MWLLPTSFVFRPPRPPREVPRAARGGSGVYTDAGSTLRDKKNKKKVRHPGLESGESAWKAEVLPLHQWRRKFIGRRTRVPVLPDRFRAVFFVYQRAIEETRGSRLLRTLSIFSNTLSQYQRGRPSPCCGLHPTRLCAPHN